jgi:hypothetical protein
MKKTLKYIKQFESLQAILVNAAMAIDELLIEHTSYLLKENYKLSMK